MADEKDEGVPDPWAGLEGVGEGDAKEDLAFSFEGFDADVAADDGGAIDDEAVAAVEELSEEVVEKIVEDSSPGLESLAAEAVVEDDIADWLGEPTAQAEEGQAATEAVDEPEFAEAFFAEATSSPDLQAFPGPDENFGESDAEEGREEVSFPMVSDAVASAGDVELEEVVAELESDEAEHEPVSVLAMGGAAAAAVAGKPKAKKKAGGGALGPILGGLMSLPIVFLILLGVLWGTGRDPIGMRSWLPSFMLPARQGGRAVAAANVKSPSLDDLATAEAEAARGETPADESDTPEAETSSSPPSEPEPPMSNAPVPAIEPPAIDDPLLAAVPGVPGVPLPESEAPAAVQEPTSLDFSGIDTAVDAALASLDRVAEAAAGPPADRRRALVAWYKDLARVGTELAMLETAAADSGRPLDDTPAAISTLYKRLGEANGVAPDLKRLCRNWVDYAKRPADGVLLVGVLDAARQVGPFWYTTLALEQVDGTMRPVSLISRRPPRADPGDLVAVAGVVFSEDMVWAADCGRLGAAAIVEDNPF